MNSFFVLLFFSLLVGGRKDCAGDEWMNGFVEIAVKDDGGERGKERKKETEVSDKGIEVLSWLLERIREVEGECAFCLGLFSKKE